MTTEATSRLADFAANFPGADIPSAVRDAARMAIVDSMGTMLAGITEPSVEILYRFIQTQSAQGNASVFGRGTRFTACHAAFANAAAAHVHDYDSLSLAVSGFVATPTLFAALALAQEQKRVTGSQLLEAVVIGYEVEAAISLGLGVSHYAKGWHSTATLAHFGAAVASARLLGLDQEAMRSVISIAASEASGLRNVVGNMLKPLHTGKAARNGVNAAVLARAGFLGNPDALECKGGFCEAFNGAGNYDLDAMVNGLASPWDLLDPGLVVKVYPCCGLLHSALDGVLALRAEHKVDPARVRRVELAVHELVPATTANDNPRSGHEAKFSAAYCIATALQGGSLGLEHFEDARVDDAAVRSLMQRVHMRVHPQLREFDTFLTREFSDVVIELDDGTRLERRVHRLDNRGGKSNPLDLDGVRAKFETCLWRYPQKQRARQALERLIHLDEADDINAITALIE